MEDLLLLDISLANHLNMDPAIPQTLAEVTPTWLSSILSKTIISPHNFHVTGNAQEGTGFLSQLLRISCQVEAAPTTNGDGDGGNNVQNQNNKELKLIVKLLPPLNESVYSAETRKFITGANLDVTEIKFYEIVQKDISEELPELAPYFCPYHYGSVMDNPRDSIIVLEDLKPRGYYTLDFSQNVSMTRIEDIVRFIAKFHYAGSAIEYKRKTPLSTLYPFLLGIPDAKKPVESSSIFNICLNGIAKLDEFFASQNCSQEMRDAYMKLVPNRTNISKHIFTAMTELPSIMHGDLWSNNVLFSDDPNSSMIVIDWQLMGYGDAAVDLAMLISSILPTSELNRANVDWLLDLYLDTFEEYCKENGMEVLIRRSRKEFFDFYYTYALGYCFALFSFSQEPFTLNFLRLLGFYEYMWKDADLITFLLTLS